MKNKMDEVRFRKYKDCISVLSEVRQDIADKDMFSMISGLSKTKIKKIERTMVIPSLDEFDAYCHTLSSFYLVKSDVINRDSVS